MEGSLGIQATSCFACPVDTALLNLPISWNCSSKITESIVAAGITFGVVELRGFLDECITV